MIIYFNNPSAETLSASARFSNTPNVIFFLPPSIASIWFLFISGLRQMSPCVICRRSRMRLMFWPSFFEIGKFENGVSLQPRLNSFYQKLLTETSPPWLAATKRRLAASQWRFRFLDLWMTLGKIISKVCECSKSAAMFIEISIVTLSFCKIG